MINSYISVSQLNKSTKLLWDPQFIAFPHHEIHSNPHRQRSPKFIMTVSIWSPNTRDANFSRNVKTVGNILEISEKRSETFRNFPIYRPSTRLLKLKNACIYDRSRKECTFTLCFYPDLFAHISRGMKYPALPASPGFMRHTLLIYSM